MLDLEESCKMHRATVHFDPLSFSLLLSQGYSRKEVGGRGGNTTENKGTKLLSLNKAHDLSAVIIGGLDFLKQFI